jgi:transposase
MSERTTRFLGLDVHKATIAVAVAEESGPPVLYGTIANDPGAVRKLVNQLGHQAKLVAAYEAGPTGYTLHHQLASLGVDCQVVAPSLVPRRAGDRVKTDSRDALARLPPPARPPRSTQGRHRRRSGTRRLRLGGRPADGGEGHGMNPRLVQVATEVGSIRREPSRTSMRFQLATLVRGSSVTARCPAAPALPTREYQADYRRQSLTSEATCATPLDNSFHIRGAAEKPGRIFGAEGAPRRSLGS